MEEVKRKFITARRKVIELISRNGLEIGDSIDYKPIFIVAYTSEADELKKELERKIGLFLEEIGKGFIFLKRTGLGIKSAGLR
ncbi:MAG: hypothetical protein QXG97_00865 [Nitrososphaerota archaeon]